MSPLESRKGWSYAGPNSWVRTRPLKLRIEAIHPHEVPEDEVMEIKYNLTNIGSERIDDITIVIVLTSVIPSTLHVGHPITIENLSPNDSVQSNTFKEIPFISGRMLLTPSSSSYPAGWDAEFHLYNKENNQLRDGQPISSFKVISSEEIGQRKEIDLALKGVGIAVGAVIIQVILQVIEWYFIYFRKS